MSFDDFGRSPRGNWFSQFIQAGVVVSKPPERLLQQFREDSLVVCYNMQLFCHLLLISTNKLLVGSMHA
ncbi:unnamed protein product [Protopolystoma xenopodis]|uniref:Uncharacterized protein n=1 Tax=Protopolystoma xenopodis TaxID=117903 RepID=A0A3S5BXV6_9PLAT|nr:unnamed protein product [Protopolystoma xenopodis]